jgi:hypothetical protein
VDYSGIGFSGIDFSGIGYYGIGNSYFWGFRGSSLIHEKSDDQNN